MTICYWAKWRIDFRATCMFNNFNHHPRLALTLWWPVYGQWPLALAHFKPECSPFVVNEEPLGLANVVGSIVGTGCNRETTKDVNNCVISWNIAGTRLLFVRLFFFIWRGIIDQWAGGGADVEHRRRSLRCVPDVDRRQRPKQPTRHISTG